MPVCDVTEELAIEPNHVYVMPPNKELTISHGRLHLAARPDVRLVRVDIRYLSEIPRETNWILNMAATPDTRFHASRPVETMTTILEGTANTIRALDPVSNIPEFKICAVRVSRSERPDDPIARLSTAAGGIS
jgi:nucleoside-diphosphate-sugar epimerase